MQDGNGPVHVQTLAQPARTRRPRVEVEPVCLVLCSQSQDGIGGYRGRRRDFGDHHATGAAEAERAVGQSLHLIARLVHRAVVAATERRQI
jgi:hypothetical protein